MTKKRIKPRISQIWLIPGVLTVFLLLLVILPLGYMFAAMDGESIQKVFAKDSFGSVLLNSVVASALTTVISLTLAYLLAWCLERTAIPGKRIFYLLLTLPMLIPSVSLGMGAVLLGGNNGILTNLLHLPSGGIYGLFGIVYASVMYTLPVAFLMMVNIFKYEDSSPYDAAFVLGLPRVRRFTAITLPYLRKPLIAMAFSVFTLSFTDYGVPLMVGGKFKTLPVLMYQEVIGQLDFGKGCVYGSILLVPALVAFLVDMLNQNHAGASFVARPFVISPSRKRDAIALVCAILMTVFSVLPILSFSVLAFVKKYPSDMILTLENFTRTIQAGAGRYLLNSILIALGVATIGVVLGVFLAYFTARHAGKIGRVLHLIAMSTGAIPGVVLGLSYVLFFKGSPIYGTIIILILVNIIHFFSSPYLMIYTSFSKLNENLESVASTLGFGRRRLLFNVFIPKCSRTVREMFSYFFVNSMMTISAVSFLANTSNKSVALMINQFEAQAQMEYAAVVSLMILTVNIAVKAAFHGGASKQR